MLLLNQTNKLTFTLHVIGTAASPTARVLIGQAPMMSYPAYKTAIADTWETTIDLPAETTEGSVPFQVEVLINGRLFTPINTMIQISSKSAEPADNAEAELSGDVTAEAKKVAEVVEPPAPKIEKEVPTPKVAQRPKSLLGSLEEAAKRKPTPIKRKAETKVEEPARISMKDIANSTPKTVGVMEAAKPIARPARPSQPPIKVTKGSVIYK